jgi:hypothetical protein
MQLPWRRLPLDQQVDIYVASKKAISKYSWHAQRGLNNAFGLELKNKLDINADVKWRLSYSAQITSIIGKQMGKIGGAMLSSGEYLQKLAHQSDVNN